MENIPPRVNRKESVETKIWYGVAGAVLLTWGINRGSLIGGLISVAGADLLTRSATGHHLHEVVGINLDRSGQKKTPFQNGIRVRQSITVGVPREQAYQFMHDFENLPRFMKHLKAVKVLDGQRSHWTAVGPANTNIEWDAITVSDVPNELISWRSDNDPDVDNAGSVRFEDAPKNLGTIIRVSLNYLPPAGAIGALVAKIFSEEPDLQIRSDLRRLKQILETGEVSTIEGQPAGGIRGRRQERQIKAAEELAATTPAQQSAGNAPTQMENGQNHHAEHFEEQEENKAFAAGSDGL